MRSRAAALVGFLVALSVSAGCGADDASPGAERTGSATPAELSKGFAALSVPLRGRARPLVVAAGNYAFVYGGWEYKPDRLLPRNDGAVYDVVQGAWKQIPKGPSDDQLFFPAGVWTGKEVVVIGTPCPVATGDETESMTCRSFSITAAAYSPEKDSWRVLKAPTSPRNPQVAGSRSNPLIAVGSGWTGREAVFRTGYEDSDHQFLLIDPDDGSSRWAPGLESTDTDCVTGGKLVAVRTGTVTPEGGRTGGGPETQAQPLETFRLNTATARWEHASDTPKPASTGSMFENATCQAGQLVYLPIKQPPVGLDTGGLWYEPDRDDWEILPTFRAAGYAGTPLPAELDGTRVLWMTSGDSLLVLPPGQTEWIRVASPMRGLVGLLALDKFILVDSTWERRPSDRLTLGLFDPQSYVAAVANGHVPQTSTTTGRPSPQPTPTITGPG
jgi:hypothetical protein